MMFASIIFETPHHLIVDFASSYDSPNFFKHVLTSLCTEPSDPKQSTLIFALIPFCSSTHINSLYFSALPEYDCSINISGGVLFSFHSQCLMFPKHGYRQAAILY